MFSVLASCYFGFGFCIPKIEYIFIVQCQPFPPPLTVSHYDGYSPRLYTLAEVFFGGNYMAKRIEKITKETQKLLLRDEGYDVDFKKNERFSSEDLVAFANSMNGGTILLGVDEVTAANGRQTGKPVGCKLDDGLRLSILNKAASCQPPIEVEIHEENGDDTPFVRIDIPSGEHKPYCTGSGTYKIRDDGANKAITPSFLLKFFVEREATEFVERFRAATDELEQSLAHMRSTVQDEINAMSRDLRDMRDDLESGLIFVQSDASEATSFAESAESISEQTYNLCEKNREDINELTNTSLALKEKVDSILIAQNIRDRSIASRTYASFVYGLYVKKQGEGTLEERCAGYRKSFFEAHPTAQIADWDAFVEELRTIDEEKLQTEGEKS
ncbi:MAG: RNA-binding domain-containing protein [Planctomycetota bacterium]